MKTCYTCKQTLPASSFAPRTNQCRDCRKAYEKAWREKHRKDIQAYRKAYRDEHRKQLADTHREWLASPAAKRVKARAQKRGIEKNPNKYTARWAVNNALRDKRLTRQPCEFCDNPKSQAHHKDYSKPLDIMWVCFKCHRELFHGQITIGAE